MRRPLLHTELGGFSLVEVLVAVAVLAIGLLSVAALQIQGVRQNLDSYARSQAVVLANDYVERMYANRVGVVAGNYAGFDSATVGCGTAPNAICGTQSDVGTPANCTAAEMATYDQYIVSCGYVAAGAPTGRSGGVQDLLQNGRITATCLPAGPPCAAGALYRVTLTWVEQIKGSNNRFTATNQQLDLTVQP